MTSFGVVKSFAGHKLSRLRKKSIAALEGYKIEKPGSWVEGRRKPVSGAVNARADVCAFCGGHSSGENRTSRLMDSSRPIQFLDEWFRPKKLAVHTVQNIEEAVAVALQQKPLRRSVFL